MIKLLKHFLHSYIKIMAEAYKPLYDNGISPFI